MRSLLSRVPDYGAVFVIEGPNLSTMGPLPSPTGTLLGALSWCPTLTQGGSELPRVGRHGSLGHSSCQQNALYSSIPWQPHKGRQNCQSHGQRRGLRASLRAGSCDLGCQEARNWQDAPWPCSAHQSHRPCPGTDKSSGTFP